MKRVVISLFILAGMIGGFQLSASAQTTDGISPKTQQYIDNLKEVKEAQNSDRPAGNRQSASQGPSAWKYVFYGALSGAVYAFWRWLKRLRRGD